MGLAAEDEVLELCINHLMPDFHAHALEGVLQKTTEQLTQKYSSY